MKTLKLLLLSVVLGLFFQGCEFEPDHSIRVTNNYPETIKNLKVGSVSYNDVSSSSTTSYIPAEEGSLTLSGYTDSGAQLSGSVSISGNGTHNWTLTIKSSGSLEITEDL